MSEFFLFYIGGVISYTTSPSTDKDNTYDGRIDFVFEIFLLIMK
jgi:hypothetical protein